MEDHHYLFPPQSANEYNEILVKLLRLTCTKLKITNEDFKRYHKHYFYNILLNTDKVQEASNYGNLKKGITQFSRITWSVFEKTMTVLGLDIVKIDITLRHKGKEFVISSKGRIDENNEYTDSPL